MTGNPLPWFVLAAVVAASLAWNGYLKFPSTAKDSNNPAPGVSVQTPSASNQGVDVEALAKLGSYVLGLAFAKAVRAEAESSLANTIAHDAITTMHATFTAPFLPPAPAGQDPNQAGVKP